MIEGEFLVADDLGPFGRIAAPGELVVLEEWDLRLVQEELKWVNGKYAEATTKAEAMRRRLPRARLGTNGDTVRELFEIWTVEAAKYALCARYLAAIIGELEQGKQAGANPPKTFRWDRLPQILDVVQRVTSAPDGEIIGGAAFRAE